MRRVHGIFEGLKCWNLYSWSQDIINFIVDGFMVVLIDRIDGLLFDMVGAHSRSWSRVTGKCLLTEGGAESVELIRIVE